MPISRSDLGVDEEEEFAEVTLQQSEKAVLAALERARAFGGWVLGVPISKLKNSEFDLGFQEGHTRAAEKPKSHFSV